MLSNLLMFTLVVVATVVISLVLGIPFSLYDVIHLKNKQLSLRVEHDPMTNPIRSGGMQKGGDKLKKRAPKRPMTEKEIDEAIKELNKGTGLITSLTYYMKPSTKKNKRNQKRRNKLKKQLAEEKQKREY